MNFVSLYASIALGAGVLIGLIAFIWMKIEDYRINKYSTHNKLTRK